MARETPERFVRRVTSRVAEIRQEREITQDQLAEALGTATRNVQRIEAGQNLTLHTLARIAAALGVSPEVLLTSSTPRSHASKKRRASTSRRGS